MSLPYYKVSFIIWTNNIKASKDIETSSQIAIELGKIVGGNQFTIQDLSIKLIK